MTVKLPMTRPPHPSKPCWVVLESGELEADWLVAELCSCRKEREVETASVPCDQHSVVSTGEHLVEFSENCGLGPAENVGDVRSGEGDRNNGGNGRVEAIDGRVRLDIQPIDMIGGDIAVGLFRSVQHDDDVMGWC